MTVILPGNYHIIDTLKSKRVDCIGFEEAQKQDIRALRIGILNIMPKAENYEFNILFSLGKSVLQIEPVWLKLESHHYSSSDRDHLDNIYVYFKDAVKDRHLDGLILTGAPVGKLEFEEIHYWEELTRILSYARRNIAGTLGLCWGGIAIAGVLGLKKYSFEKKLFGVFEGENLDREHPITGELDDVFFCPQSRYAGISDEDMERARDNKKIRLLAKGKEPGYFIFESMDGRYIAHLGHPEYNSQRLVDELLRDREAGLTDVDDPANFNIDNPLNRWRGHRNEFFTQWIKYVYDYTEY
jgi:homoserine O-succinyltransferase